jgi:hypothetical protein
MITEKKVSIYEKYNGFVEAYIFENSDLPNENFELMDWSLIDELIGSIILLNSGNASPSFENQLKDFIGLNTENYLVVEHLEKLAKSS